MTRAEPAEGRFVGLDGLRGVGAVAIVAAHTWLNLGSLVPVGPFSVPLQRVSLFLVMFFVLSGFLLYRPFVAAALAGRPLRVRRYLRNRVLRVWPAWLVVLGVSGLVLGVATVAPLTLEHGLAPTLPRTGWLWTAPELLGINAFFGQSVLPSTLMTGIGPGWSLSLEVSFYLLLPVFCLVFRRRVWLPPLLSIGVGLVGKTVHVSLLSGLTPQEAFLADWGPTWEAVFARSLPVHADLLGLGMAVAVLCQRGFASRGPILLAAVGGLVATEMLPTYVDTGWGVFWAASILLIATRQQGVVARALDLRPVRWMGEISYSVYLWHLPVILLLVKTGVARGENHAGLGLNLLLVFAVTVPLAHLTWKYVERPAMAHKRRSSAVAAAV